MPVNIGYWLDTWNEQVAAILRAGEPFAVLVAQGAWDQLLEINEAAGNPLIILREIGLRTDVDHPIASAQRLCGVAKRHPGLRCIAHGINEPTVETAEQRATLVTWELAFIAEAHRLGVKTVCLNLAWGNPGDMTVCDEFRPIHDASDYVGLHLYAVSGFDDLYSCYRYQRWPAWFDRAKLISTEVGIDGLDRINGERPGWRTQGLNEWDVIAAMLARSWQWAADGIQGGIWFAAATQNSEWEPYYPTLEMAQAWGELATRYAQEKKEAKMSLAEQYPDQSAAWLAAGGNAEEAFEWFLRGQGIIQTDKGKAIEMMDNLLSHVEEMKSILAALPLA